MTSEEKSIWQATYATAFANNARNEEANTISPNYRYACQRAIETADKAIRGLRDWRKTGLPNAGKKAL